MSYEFIGGNGLFAGGDTANLVVERCHIHGNGIVGSVYEHNAYTESKGILYQHNRFGTLRDGANGNNLKDRSSGCIVRYNWIENGNRQLDLVESATLFTEPDYTNTYVYGNVLIETFSDGNRQIVHYGGDGADLSRYRKGRLHFFNNTVVSKRSDRTTLFRLSTRDKQADCAGNILYVTLAGNTLAMLDDTGMLYLRDNWSKPGWVDRHFEPASGTIHDSGGNIVGDSPGFFDESGDNYRLTAGSPCVDSHTRSPTIKPDYDGISCPLDGKNDGVSEMDMGAFEFAHPAADSDGDGFLDWMEIVAGTDPTNRLSFFRCTAIAIADGSYPAVTWTSESNRTYRLERADSLATDFAFVATNIPAGPPLNTHTDTTAAVSGTLFYRVAVE